MAMPEEDVDFSMVLGTGSQAPSGVPPPAAMTPQESDEQNRDRFIIELEFVQCLAHPFYLLQLAQTRMLDDPAFIRYLNYLQYWRSPEYVKYIKYPHCLYFLELLQQESFRETLKHPDYAQSVFDQQFFHWWHHQSNRRKFGHSLASVKPEP